MNNAPNAQVSLESALSGFASANKFRGKGPLCVALVVTEHAKERSLPLDPEKLITEGAGQVLGLGKAKVQSILARHGITKILAAEGGRTSRGSIGNMRAYVAFLNGLAEQQDIDLDEVERWWVEQVRVHFAAKPFILKMDAALSVRATIANLISEVAKRQKESSGATLVGTVMQHLVGAKLEAVLAGRGIELNHHGASQNDAKGRGGDFDLGDAVLHVTNAPSEDLIRKCGDNLSARLQPIIVTSRKGVSVAEGLAEQAGLGSRIDVLDFEQFLAANVHELSAFDDEQRRVTLADIIERYNNIVATVETDPSLMVEIK